MTFLERYNQESTWHGKAIVMEIYHLAMTQRQKGWTITRTAEHFDVSVGLVSENLRLAHAIHKYEQITKQGTRQDALKWLKHRDGWRD